MTDPIAMAGAAAGAVRRRVFRADLLLLAAAVLGGALIGRSLANGQIMFAGLVAGFVLVVALLQAEWLPYVACVAIVATFADQAGLPQVGIPGNPFVSDLLLIAAFIAWFILLGRPHVLGPKAFPVAPQVAVGLVLLGSLVGVVVGYTYGVAPLEGVRHARDIAFYAAFWLALTAFAEPRSRILLFKLGAIAAVAITVAQVAQGILGASTILFYVQDPLAELLTCPSGLCPDPKAEGFPRVRPPGLILVYTAACFAAAYLLWGPRRRRMAVATVFGISCIGILVSLNRNMIIGLVMGIVLAGLLSARRGRLAFVMAIAAVLVLVAAAASSGGATESSILARVTTLANPAELESSRTIESRLAENRRALAAIADSPLLGLGWGVPYGLTEIHYVDGQFVTEKPLFVHQQYLHLWLRAGLLGLLGLLAALFLSVRYGTSWLRRRGDDAWIGAGVIVATTAIATSSLVGIYIVNPASAPVLAGLFALAACLRRDLAEGW